MATKQKRLDEITDDELDVLYTELYGYQPYHQTRESLIHYIQKKMNNKTKSPMQQAIDALTLEAHDLQLKSESRFYTNWERAKIKARADQNFSNILFLSRLRDEVEKNALIESFASGVAVNASFGVKDTHRKIGRDYYERTFD